MLPSHSQPNCVSTNCGTGVGLNLSTWIFLFVATGRNVVPCQVVPPSCVTYTHRPSGDQLEAVSRPSRSEKNCGGYVAVSAAFRVVPQCRGSSCFCQLTPPSCVTKSKVPFPFEDAVIKSVPVIQPVEALRNRILTGTSAPPSSILAAQRAGTGTWFVTSCQVIPPSVRAKKVSPEALSVTMAQTVIPEIYRMTRVRL